LGRGQPKAGPPCKVRKIALEKGKGGKRKEGKHVENKNSLGGKRGRPKRPSSNIMKGSTESLLKIEDDRPWPGGTKGLPNGL